MKPLRWILFPFVYFFLSFAFFVLNSFYFQWLAGINWLIIILLLPISFWGILSQYFAIFFAIRVAPNQKIARYLVLALFICSIFFRPEDIKFKFDSLDSIINLIASAMALILIMVELFEGKSIDEI